MALISGLLDRRACGARNDVDAATGHFCDRLPLSPSWTTTTATNYFFLKIVTRHWHVPGGDFASYRICGVVFAVFSAAPWLLTAASAFVTTGERYLKQPDA